jgi:hypothetical protein
LLTKHHHHHQSLVHGGAWESVATLGKNDLSSKYLRVRATSYIYIYIHIYACMYIHIWNRVNWTTTEHGPYRTLPPARVMYICIYVYIYIYVYTQVQYRIRRNSIWIYVFDLDICISWWLFVKNYVYMYVHMICIMVIVDDHSKYVHAKSYTQHIHFISSQLLNFIYTCVCI